jgi:hypothetical protein
MKMSRSKYAYVILFPILMLLLPFCLSWMVRGVRLTHVQANIPFYPEWETDLPANSEILGVLDQPFSYLGKGLQCFVFQSQDGNYVVKLFRSAPPAKMASLLNAFKLAYDRAQEETGLLYVHLNPTSEKIPLFQCRDALGRPYRLHLESYRFAIQRKAKPFRETLLASLSDHTTQKRIDQFLALLKARAEKGIGNLDSNLSRNFGFLEDRAIELDFGNYFVSPALSDPDGRFREVQRYVGSLKNWLEKTAPEWGPYLDEKILYFNY